MQCKVCSSRQRKNYRHSLGICGSCESWFIDWIPYLAGAICCDHGDENARTSCSYYKDLVCGRGEKCLIRKRVFCKPCRFWQLYPIMLESTRIDDRETFLKLPYSKSKHLPNKSNVNILTSIKFSHRDSDGLHIFTYLLPSNQQMYPPFVTHQYLVSIPTQLQDHHYSAYNTRGDVAYRDPVSSFIEFRTHLFTFFSESHCSRDEILIVDRLVRRIRFDRWPYRGHCAGCLAIHPIQALHQFFIDIKFTDPNTERCQQELLSAQRCPSGRLMAANDLHKLIYMRSQFVYSGLPLCECTEVRQGYDSGHSIHELCVQYQLMEPLRPLVIAGNLPQYCALGRIVRSEDVAHFWKLSYEEVKSGIQADQLYFVVVEGPIATMGDKPCLIFVGTPSRPIFGTSAYPGCSRRYFTNPALKAFSIQMKMRCVNMPKKPLKFLSLIYQVSYNL